MKKAEQKNMNNARSISWFFIITFCINIFYVPASYAGGPTQPEVQSFMPIGFDNMVNPFTGDFSYNIPLMEIEGYPLNLAYNAGVTMDQEASWVGLGWNLNAGAVNRYLRGIPDDFDGDTIITKKNLKENKIYSLDFGQSVEVVALNTLGVTLSATQALSFNDYRGWAAEQGFGVDISLKNGKDAQGALSMGLSISGSSENGASFSPSLGLSVSGKESDNRNISLGTNIGCSINSRAGLSQISYGFSMSASEARKNPKGMSSKQKEAFNPNSMGGLSGGSSFNIGTTSFPVAVQNNMKTINFSGNFKLGLDVYTVDPTGSVTISFSKQFIPDDQKKLSSPSYGYFNMEKGQTDKHALLDFTRDNDGTFTDQIPYLPSATLTNDVFSVQAQGIGGSFKGYRNDVGYVFDPKSRNVSDMGSLGFEMGAPGLFKLAANINMSETTSESSSWDDANNMVKNQNKFRSNTIKRNNYSLIEANDFSVDEDNFFNSQLAGDSAVRFRLQGNYEIINALTPGTMLNSASGTQFKRSAEYPKNTLLQTKTIGDLRKGFGINTLYSGVSSEAKNHHLGELIYLGNDGRRYVFDIPAYNNVQEDVTFAVGSGLNGNGSSLLPSDEYNGIVNYGSPSVASENNSHGVDNYYNSRTTPAYAHAFMLSSVLTDDYIDSDDIKGPSKNDYGNYVKFNYLKVSDYKWRNPPTANEASYNEGLKSIKSDDKASFIYGEKDILYVTKIESKNYVILFTFSDRYDMYSVNGRDGGLNTGKKGLKIERIDKYSRIDYEQNGPNATPIQSVHFEYDYSLCSGNPTTSGAPSGQSGKLTLKKVYFTYQGSNKMKYSPYEFNYAFNPGYNLKAVDRWGAYSPVNGSGAHNPLSSALPNFEYPYTVQNKALADQYASAWNLTTIKLPSGGVISVQYEADDYRYVQDKEANRMFKIVSTEEELASADPDAYELHPASDNFDKNQRIYFKMIPGYNNIHDYIDGVEHLYFRCLTDMRGQGSGAPENYEYISGYGKIEYYGDTVVNGVKLGWLKLKVEKLQDSGNSIYSPITKAAIQFGRMYLSEYINDISLAPSGNDTENGLLDLADAVLNSFASFSELFQSPNLKIYNLDRGKKIVTNKSWIRLKCPSKTKYGGGHRVKRILMYDNWQEMTGEGNFYYGQEYSYKGADGITSGVAENEPMLGADESPLRQPAFYNEKYRMAPDQNLYVDALPLESQFPSPNIGYARVEIKNLSRPGVIRTATGKIVKEYYTARDFPFSITWSTIDPRPYSQSGMFQMTKNTMHASQGFALVTNDMHGKEKKQTVYGENSSYPISDVEYSYKTEGTKLDNTVDVIYPDGTVQEREIGVRREAVGDFRKSETKSRSMSINVNANGIYAFVVITIPMIIPSMKRTQILFKSATLSKQTQQFGILQKTRATENGASIETNNLVYDANSGQPLITQTINNFNDSIYNVTYPAYWKYENMGMAYKNLDTYKTGVDISSGTLSWNNAPATFAEGDELAIISGNTNIIGWVAEVNQDNIKIINKQGDPVSLSNATLTIIRSGRKNKQTEPMATLTSMSNPIPRIKYNNYSKVLNASAIEFSQHWSTYCECIRPGDPTYTTNPFVMGTKGFWRPSKSFTHLTDRVQSNYNGNTNIRKDGVFASYTPYYYLNGSKWEVNPANWTFVSEVTQFGPNGTTLETKDAIGRYSSTAYSFNNTLQTSAVVNASLKEHINFHFEDDISACGSSNGTVSPMDKSGTAHTGRNSIRVTAAQPVTINSSDISCPKPGCNLELSAVEKSWKILNSTGDIQLDYEIVYGIPVVNFDVTNKMLHINNLTDEDYEITVKITDAEGCQLLKTVQYPPQN